MITKFYLVSLRGRQHSCGSSSPLAVQHPAWSGRRPQPRRPFFPAAQSPNWTAWAVPIINVSVASACLAAVLVVGASFLARVSETRRRSGAAWGGRRRRLVQLMGVDLAVQFLSLVFFLVPSALVIAHPCSWFLVQTQVLQLSFLQLLIFLQLLNFLLLNFLQASYEFLAADGDQHGASTWLGLAWLRVGSRHSPSPWFGRRPQPFATRPCCRPGWLTAAAAAAAAPRHAARSCSRRRWCRPTC